MAEWSRVAKRIRVPLGFAFAVLYFWLARPTWKFLALGAVLIAPGLLIRALASGHVRKNEELATSGPYAYTRNPLYLGSMGIAFGIAIAAGRWSLGLLLAVMFLAISCALRWASAATIAWMLRLPIAGLWLLPVRDLLSFAVFIGSFCGRNVSWRDQLFRIEPSGRIVVDGDGP